VACGNLIMNKRVPEGDSMIIQISTGRIETLPGHAWILVSAGPDNTLVVPTDGNGRAVSESLLFRVHDAEDDLPTPTGGTKNQGVKRVPSGGGTPGRRLGRQQSSGVPTPEGAAASTTSPTGKTSATPPKHPPTAVKGIISPPGGRVVTPPGSRVISPAGKRIASPNVNLIPKTMMEMKSPPPKTAETMGAAPSAADKKAMQDMLKAAENQFRIDFPEAHFEEIAVPAGHGQGDILAEASGEVPMEQAGTVAAVAPTGAIEPNDSGGVGDGQVAESTGAGATGAGALDAGAMDAAELDAGGQDVVAGVAASDNTEAKPKEKPKTAENTTRVKKSATSTAAAPSTTAPSSKKQKRQQP